MLNPQAPTRHRPRLLAAAVLLLTAITCMASLLNHAQAGTSAAVLNQPPTAAQPLRIGIIGAGWLGGTVGKLLVQAGHEVMFSSRHPEELKPLAEELGARASVGTPKEAAAFGNVLLFAVPYDAIPQLGIDLKEEMKGKIVLDACNGGSGQLGEEVAAHGAGPTTAKYLPGTRLVRGFSSEDATAIEASAKRTTTKLAVPLASDDKAALEVAAQLVREVGCEPIIVGDLATGVKFQRSTPAFRANTTVPELRRRLGLPAK